ncbi:MAG: alginate export family protein [Bacteroidales bacterium]|nr:alginate export family protein [Bacteroidales bacterium]
MKRVTLFFLVCILFLAGNDALGQLTLSAELRPRFEMRNGYGNLANDTTDPIFIISQRTRLKAVYTHKVFGAGICIQDARAWGSDDIYSSTGTAGNSASINLSEGWFELYITPSLTAKAGRQFLVYDDERIFSTRNWGQAAVTYDALVLKYKNEKKWDLDLGGVWNNSSDKDYFNAPYPSAKIKMILYGHFHKQIGESLNLSAIAIATGFNKENNYRILYTRGTYGINLDFKKDDLKLRATGYYQNGVNKNGKQVQAYFTSAVGAYTVNPFTLGAGIDYISGQDATETSDSYTDKDHLFDLLYGNRHAYYGFMDLFSNVPRSTDNGGLMDIFVNVKYKPAEKHNLQLDYHYFSLAQHVKADPDKSLGSELDFVYRYTVNEFLSGDVGYSFMKPTETMAIVNDIGGHAQQFSHWVYLMITLKPTLLKM